MTWFTRLCRQTGLTIHHIVKPVKDDNRKRELNRKVEEKKVNDSVTLRRTTIDEIEIRQDGEKTR
ncbi:hypothetical protein ACERK3_03270 [Phycisphaerales bacterium AB-hyl4]|uniref:Transposase n=1 Tax=Natronomicrosphaera hydrolytica TaxID=3242702 RepID=A0ABV4U3G1_9BACT